MTYQAVHERFARFIRERLRQANDGRLPSVSVITARFNHVDNWQRPVSPETMRRWLRGLSLPELSRLPALCRLLGCSPMDVVEALGFAEILVAQAAAPLPDQAEASARACDALRLQVIEIMRGMDEPRLKAMVSLFERRSRPRSGRADGSAAPDGAGAEPAP